MAFVQGTDLKDETLAEIKSLPTKIHVNGLIAVAAYLEERKKDDRKKDDRKPVADTLRGRLSAVGLSGSMTQWLSECSGHDYARATEEALAYCNWLKRWASAKEAEKDQAARGKGVKGGTPQT